MQQKLKALEKNKPKIVKNDQEEDPKAKM